MMALEIPSVRGCLSISELGLTSMHEHVPLDLAGPYWNDAFEFAVRELALARELGLSTIVEVSPRRDALGLQKVAEESGINILTCTGFYQYTDEEKGYSIEQFCRHMLEEIENGINGTDVRPAVLKIATGIVPAEHEIRALKAVGRVQRETGLPVCVHSVGGCKLQQEILESAGADLTRVYFCHIEAEFGWEGRTIDEEIYCLLEVVKKGSVLCYNNFGNWAHTRPENLLRIIQTMIQEGFADYQVISIDCIWSYENGQRKILWEDINLGGYRRTYSYLLSDVVPWLCQNRIPEECIMKMLRDTPRRLLQGCCRKESHSIRD